MRTSDRGKVALAIHEGLVPGPYRDTKQVWTFGVGHTAAAGAPDPAKMARGLPRDLDGAIAAAADLFSRDLARYEAEVNAALQVKVSQHEFDALVSFHYNTGAIGKATLVELLNGGDRRGAAAAFMNWSKPASIVGRRKAERDLFAYGTYPTGEITVWGVDGAGNVVWKPVRRIRQDDFLALLGDGTAGAAPVSPLDALVQAFQALARAIMAWRG